MADLQNRRADAGQRHQIALGLGQNRLRQHRRAGRKIVNALGHGPIVERNGAGISHIVLASPKVDDGCRDGISTSRQRNWPFGSASGHLGFQPRFSYVKSFAPARNTCQYPTPRHVDEDVQPSHARRAPARDPIKVYDARWEIDDFDEAEVSGCSKRRSPTAASWASIR